MLLKVAMKNDRRLEKLLHYTSGQIIGQRGLLVILFPCSTPIDLSVRILRNFNTDRRDRRNTH